jgi:hypothetical protein
MPIKVLRPLGANVDEVSSTATHALGEEAWGQDNSKFVYVLANSAITTSMAVGMNKSYSANPLTKTHVDAGRKVGVAQNAMAVGQYGWVAVRGGNDLLKVRVKNSCAVSVALYTTSTAGYLDDTSASQTLVNGIVLTDTATSSGAREECFINTEMSPTPTP